MTPKSDIKIENEEDLHRSNVTSCHPQDFAVKQEVKEEEIVGNANSELLNLPAVTKIKVELTFENVPSVTKLPSLWDCYDDSDSSIGVVPKHKGEMLESEDLSDLSREKIVTTVSPDVRRSSRIANNKVINIIYITIHLTKTTAAQTEDALSYYRVRGLYFLAVVFVTTIFISKL